MPLSGSVSAKEANTHILFSFLYGEKAPGEMLLIRFCSSRLQKEKWVKCESYFTVQHNTQFQCIELYTTGEDRVHGVIGTRFFFI